MFRARVVNPRWIGAMQRHGYKGAFELAATVDYLFGFDATAGVVTTGCTRRWPGVRPRRGQPGVHEALEPVGAARHRRAAHEAAERGLWAEPDPELLAEMQQVYLDVEGDLEDG